MSPFGRSDERGIPARVQGDAKEAGAPKCAAGLIAALGIFFVKDFAPRAAVIGERGMIALEHQAQPGQKAFQADFVTLTTGGKLVAFERTLVNGAFVPAEMD